MREFKDMLRQIMDEKQLKAVDVCRMTGLGSGAISQYLSGARDVILIREAQDLIRSLPSGEYLFMRYGRRIRGMSFSRQLRKVCHRLGIPEKSCHAIRKTYCSQLLNAGMPLAEVQHLMGHTSPRTTLSAYYYNNSSILSMQETLEAAVGKFVK